jgi:hypothetical protein
VEQHWRRKWKFGECERSFGRWREVRRELFERRANSSRHSPPEHRSAMRGMKRTFSTHFSNCEKEIEVRIGIKILAIFARLVMV